MKSFARYWAHAITCLVFVLQSSAFAAEQCDVWAAKVQSLQGTVEIKASEAHRWQHARLNQILCSGDSVRLSANSRAAIRLQNETILRLDENSQIVLSHVAKKESSWIELLNGIAHFISRTPKSLEIKTPFVNAAIDGTEFVVEVNENNARVIVFEGQVSVSNEKGKIVLQNNEAATTNRGQAPKPLLIANPRNSVQWALYYPPVIDYQSKSITDPNVQAVLNAFYQNESATAFALLEQLPKTLHTGEILTLKASLLLNVGQSEKALRTLDQALEHLPNMSAVFALKSIIALTQGDLSRAQEFADKSLLNKRDSAIARIAHSYISQANFDLETARRLVREAAMFSPTSPLVWARLSELELSFEELDLALDAANKSIKLAPDYVHTQVTLGFAQLYRFDSGEALKVFTHALQLAPYSPLANLGMGLSTIQTGDLDGGVKFLESAAIMDPNNALLRSYLGKGYYDQNRFQLAEVELNVATTLDKNDPSAFLYRALLYNRLGEPRLALNDLQQSIQMNNNRAIYRSKQLLDRDLATRNASLAPIYYSLGFEKKALLESWKSIIFDPTNFSSHRFLSSTYSKQPRHEIASTSENLQSKLLQPINIFPYVTNSPSEIILSNQSILETSSTRLNPLYVKNGTHSNIITSSGSNKSKFLTASVYGLSDKFSFNFNHQQLSTNGFQQNDDFSQNQQNFFMQYAVNHKLGLQVEYLDKELKYGDIPFRLNGIRKSEKRNQISRIEKRIGINYRPNTKQTFLFSSIHGKSDSIETDFTPYPLLPPSIKRGGIEDEDSGTEIAKSFESQFIYDSKRNKLIFGVGRVSYTNDVSYTETLVADDIRKVLDPIITKTSRKHENIYLYHYLSKFSKKLILTTGLSAERFNSDNFSKQKLNPKLGAIITPVNSTTIRFAAFKSLKRPIVSSQTIEPTQVSGFNQFFDDIRAASSTRYGFGIDQAINNDIFLGFEVSRRDLVLPIYLPKEGRFKNFERSEFNKHGYLNWAINSYAAFNLKVVSDSFNQDFTAGNGDESSAKKVNTFSIPSSIYIHTGGSFSIRFKGTYIDQKAEFANDNTSQDTLDKYGDRFLVFDVESNFRSIKGGHSISVLMKNILNEKMKYQSNFDGTTPRISPFKPERTLIVKLNLSF